MPRRRSRFAASSVILMIGGSHPAQERDETIQDKENRIYDLKKKNQELEKFKFVLDYKIRELKKQIEPREKDIVDMKVQIGQVCGKMHACGRASHGCCRWTRSWPSTTISIRR